MNVQEITDKIKSKFPDAIIEGKLEGVVDPFIKVSPSGWQDLASFLKNDDDLLFDYLMCLSGVDYGKGMLGVVYNIYSMKKKHKLNVKIEVPKDNPEIHSIADIWKTANWHEREAYDLIGIRFIGHPDLRRILNPDDWEGHPLQKDYKVPESYQGMKVPY